MKFGPGIAWRVSALAVAASLLLLSHCSGPIEPPRSDDYIEFESVWQYLKAYSIYQDSSIYEGRIPTDPFAYSSTDAMMRAVGDTLYGAPYTHYTAVAPEVVLPGTTTAAASAEVSANGSTVVLDTLTDSTVRISISSFEFGSTYNEFIEVLPRVRQFPFVVIDLRGNGGGDIDDATSIVNAFLPAGSEYIMARERNYDVKTHSARTVNWHSWKTRDVARPELKGKQVTVLMNGNSASASEILIAALKDCRAGTTLVGSRSYGKGIGQIKIHRRDRQTLQITFLQMRGMSVRIGNYHHKGIEPDSSVTGTDLQQLLAAVRVHEPSIGQLRPLRKQAIAAPTPVAGYRTVYEE